MKQIINFSILFFVVVLAFSSCGEGFLNRQPLDQVTESNFYKTDQDARRAVTACYSVLQGVNWHGKSWMLTEIPSDNSTTGGNDPDFSPIDNFTISADNGPNAEFWAERFRLVGMANQVINQVPGIEMEEIEKQSIISEARFLRAYAYFDLVRIYGDVPIITEVPTINSDLLISRDPIDQVFSFIIEDLKSGAENLPATRSGIEVGRATIGASKAVLAKVYLTTKDYLLAAETARQVISSGTYRLMEDFADNWLKDKSDNNAEAVFQIQYAGCGPIGTGNACQAFFAPWGQGITKNTDGWGSQIPTSPSIDNPGTTIKDAYSDDDLRAFHTFMAPNNFYPDINAEDGGYMYPNPGVSRSGINIKKYVIGGGADVCFMTTPQNYHAVRYADVLLSLVEAECARNGGISVTPDVLQAFNAIVNRAGLPSVESVTTEMVFDERRREFAFENQRWFDLLRQGNVRNTMAVHGKSMQDFHLLFPIPAEELAVNPNLKQNTGY